MTWSLSRYELIQSLVEKLTAAEAKHLIGLESKLLAEHQEHYPRDKGFFVDGFYFKGPNDFHYDTPRHSLKAELLERGRMLLESERQLNIDKDYFVQMFSVLFRRCQTMQEIRDAIPDILLPMMSPAYAKLDRQKEDGWSMNPEPYKRLKDKIYAHAANRMLY